MTDPAVLTDGPDATTGVGAAVRRLTGLSLEAFGRDYWSQQALLTRGAGDFSDLFTAAAVDELIADRALRTPFLRLAKDGATIADARFTAPAGVGASIGDQIDDTAVWRQFAAGSTIVAQALHRSWRPLATYSSELAAELGHPVQANAYITPPQNQGFDDHYDVHDVFVLQVEGAKRWIIHKPTYDAPLRDQPWSTHRDDIANAATQEPVIDTILQPGDCLYLPRGWIHAAQAQGAVSIHVTLGVHVWTAYAIAEQLAQAALAQLRDDPAARRSLPVGGDASAALIEQVRGKLCDAIQNADPQPGLRRAKRTSARPAPLHPLAQHAALATLDDSSRIRLRGGLSARWDGTRLHTDVGWIDLPEHQYQAITTLLDEQPHMASELGIELAQRLLTTGIAVPDAS